MRYAPLCSTSAKWPAGSGRSDDWVFLIGVECRPAITRVGRLRSDDRIGPAAIPAGPAPLLAAASRGCHLATQASGPEYDPGVCLELSPSADPAGFALPDLPGAAGPLDPKLSVVSFDRHRSL